MQGPCHSQQHQVPSFRAVEEPTRAYSVRQANSRHPDGDTFGSEPIYTRNPLEDTRFVTSQELRCEIHDTSYPHPIATSARRQSELVLPSIEGDVPNAKDQQILTPNQLHCVDDFPERNTERRERLRQRASSMNLLDGDEPQMKRRRIDDRQPLDDCQQRTVLVPLHYGVQESPRMLAGHAETVYYDDVPPMILDKRIIKLPPRKAERYENDQGRIHFMTPHRHAENQSFHQMTGKEFGPHYVNTEVHGWPQSPKSSIAFPPVYDHQSPILLNTSAPSYREVIDQGSSSLLTSAVDEGGARSIPDPYASRGHLHRFEDEGKEMRAKFRDLELDPQHHRNHDKATILDMNTRRPVQAMLQGHRTTYVPISSQTDRLMVDHEAHRQLRVPGNPFETRHTQQKQQSIQTRAAKSGGWRPPADVYNLSQQSEKGSINPMQRYSNPSQSNAIAVQWCD